MNWFPLACYVPRYWRSVYEHRLWSRDSDQSVLCKDGRRCATQEVVKICAEITACSGVIVIDAETAAAWPTEGLGQEESLEVIVERGRRRC